MDLIIIVLAFVAGYALAELIFELRRRRPATIVLTVPIIEKQGVLMADFQIPLNSTAFIPIQTLDANGNVVPPPPGDTFTAASNNPAIAALIGAMPSGPLQGAIAAQLTTSTTVISGVEITVTDSAGLTPGTLACDVIGGAPVSISLDAAGAVIEPNTPPA